MAATARDDLPLSDGRLLLCPAENALTGAVFLCRGFVVFIRTG